jgi:hypothetical protein
VAFVLLSLWGLSQQTPAVGPVIKLDKETHDFGTISRGANGDAKFMISNTGTEELIISECITHCSCTALNCPQKAIAPGETISFRVTYDTKRIGPFEKGVELVSNAVNAGNLMLLLIGTVEE